MSYTSPRTWIAAETVSAAQLNTHLRDQLLHIAGTSGFTATPGATRGIEPTSGYFMGATAVNRHTETGNTTISGGSTASPTFANAYGSNPNVISQGNLSTTTVESISTTGCTLRNTNGSQSTSYWIAEGPD